MSIKPRYKRRIIWSLISVIGLFLLSIIIIPPMINLNSLKSKIENTIFTQTGIHATIHGNINFSLIGKTTIIAHNITTPNGFVSSLSFAIPWFDIFNIKNAKIPGDITINGASISLNKITPFNMKNNIIINDSKFKFLNKEYEIINGHFSKDFISGIIRTDQHKYEIKSFDNNFTIKNKNNNLDISGQLASNGTATAHISIIAQDINRWFEFKYPRIRGQFPIVADIKWDGGYGLDFDNISANGVTGFVKLYPDGYKSIKLKSRTADYDMSFAVKNPEVFLNTSFDMDFYGKIKFMDKTFKHLYVNVIGHKNIIDIKKIIADDLIIENGNIDANGANNLNITIQENGIPTKCLFSGTHYTWSCKTFSYGDKIFGDIKFDKDYVTANIHSDEKNVNLDLIIKSAKKLSDKGTIIFQFQDMAGTIKYNGKKHSIEYDYAINKSLKWAKIEFNFLPDFMLSEYGDFVWKNGTMLFTPKSKTWSLAIKQDSFYIYGDNFKKWLTNLDLQSMHDLPYTLSGNYNKGNISNLNLDIAKQKFNGSVSGKSVTLKTDLLNIDAFTSQEFLNNYDALSFFVVAPITVPFDININISLSADSLIYNGHKYNNFVYALKSNTQTFSITDSNRGNMLATLKKKNNKYTADIQLNKFVIDEKILQNDMPLNISDSTITAEIRLKTYGRTAHDLFENINGTFDLYFNGGKLYGLGLADFYASAQNISTLNAEYALAKALETGVTPLKNMQIIGTYDHGDIQTTKPISLALKHTDIVGNLQITDNKMSAELKLMLRGTSSEPAPIDLIIYPNNNREYSLSEIMISFDPEYMRSFIQSHNQF